MPQPRAREEDDADAEAEDDEHLQRWLAARRMAVQSDEFEEPFLEQWKDYLAQQEPEMTKWATKLRTPVDAAMKMTRDALVGVDWGEQRPWSTEQMLSDLKLSYGRHPLRGAAKMMRSSHSAMGRERKVCQP